MDAVTRHPHRTDSPAIEIADVPVPFLRQTASGRVLAISAALLELLGHETVEHLAAATGGRAEALYLRPEDRGALAAELDGAARTTRLYALRSRHGTGIEVVDQARRGISVCGRHVTYESHFANVSGLCQRIEAITRLEARYRLIVDAVADGVYLSQDDRITWSSDRFNEMLGMTAGEMRGRALSSLVARQSIPLLDMRREVLDDERAAHSRSRIRVMLNRRHDQRALPVEITESRLSTPEGPVVVGIAHDLTRQLDAQKRLAHDAFHDALTGLPNRKYFTERLAQRMEPGHPANRRGTFAVLFIDLDNFKLVNDAHGHEAGDRFLVEAVQRLRSCLRDADVLSRHGGDEFTILVDNASSVDEVTAIATRIQRRLAERPLLDDLGLYTTSSIGIVFDHPRYQLPEEIMRDADTAMYHAKENGKADCAIFDGQMLQEVRDRLRLESELRRASGQDELVNHYQPIFSVDGRCIGMEALARWHHPERGVLGPDEFFHALQVPTLFKATANHFFHRAVKDLKLLIAEGLVDEQFTVSLNVSEKQLQSGTLPDELDALLRGASLPRHRVTLEIVESVLSKTPKIIEEIFRLKEAGFALAIDDFGTGTSSLATLRDIPVDIVKIDKSFLADGRDGARGYPFLRKILETIGVLGLQSLVEGVEQAEQFAFLKKADCDYAQGFLLARPMPMETIRRLLVP